MTLALLGGEPIRKRPFTRWPVFDGREHAAIEDVLSSGQWGGFPSPNRKATEFSRHFAEFQGAQFVVQTSSGTTALEVALKALDIGPGDEVIVPAITFAATAYAVVACMARPVFADVNPDNVCIDPASVRRLIGPRTRAIVPVHYGSSLADLDALTAIARERNLAVVEDCAHVPGARWRERGVGTWGDLGCFSFQTTKPMTAGEGGAIATDDRALEERCQSLINCAPSRGDSKPARAARNRFVHAMRAEGIPCGVGNDPAYRSALLPLDSRAYRTACELAGVSPDAVEIGCPAAEPLFQNEIAALPHECLLGGEADVDDIIAAVEKIAHNARALAAAKLDRAG